MPTGDKQVNIFLNRLLDKTALKEQFLEFLSKKADDGIVSLTAGQSGTLDADKVGLSASINDAFDLDMTLARRLAVGGGQVITLPINANRISGEHKEVPFENTAALKYEVGIKYASVKSGIAINTRSGLPEYPSQLEDIGELGNPSSVVNAAGVKITLKIDNLTQAAIDHSGRLVRCRRDPLLRQRRPARSGYGRQSAKHDADRLRCARQRSELETRRRNHSGR
jgi:hypothetical protein